MASENLHLVASFVPKPGKFEEFSAAAQEMIKGVHASESDIFSFYAFEVKDESNQQEILFVERYKNQAAFESHKETAHFKAFAKLLPELLEKPLEIKQGSLVYGHENGALL